MSKLSFHFPYIILLLCIFLYVADIPVVYSNNETDLGALLAFRNAIDSDPQGALNSWNETVHFCSWQGVLCSRRHKDRVVEIYLMSRGLVGSVSPYLGNLSFLQSITLKNNSFYGQIPNEIGRLRRLEHVEFSNNSFSGEIPKNISYCTDINYLNLIGNKLSGIIPLELSSLMKLENLGLSLNPLSGTIPPFIGNFTSLVELSLGHCGMQGKIPESLVQLKSLQYLTLNENNLTGSIPQGLFNISTMIVFQVPSNQLEGALPSDIGSTFSSLNRLYLWDNHFTGQIPTSLSNISLLEYLALELNSFKGNVEIDFSRLSALTFLSLAANNLEGNLNFFSSMENCTQLMTFEISSNQLTGSLPPSISNLSSHLSVLAIRDNQLYGKIPPGIGNLPGLAEIDLYGNNLDGPVPSEIGKLNNLQALYLTGNRFLSEIPSSFGNLTSMIYLHLDRNIFSGNVPQSLSNCTNLLQLNISRNNLIGSIPHQIMTSVSNLIFFDLSHNDLSGSIPIEVGSLINLGYLDLSYNRFSGHVQKSLSSCVRLEEVYLQSNSLYGEIPDELRTLRGLRRLDLSQNNISGTIPAFLGELDLLYLNLSFNSLAGGVPNQGVFMNKSALSLEGNKDLCGGIPSLNFTSCSLEKAKKKHFPLLFKVLIPVVSVGAIALACFCIFICSEGISKHAQTSDMGSLEDGYLRLSYADILKSTDGFSELNLIGAGRFGTVYKGNLHGMETSVAIKVLHLNVKGALKSFMSECNILRNIRHRNLVKILSLCSSTDFQENEFKALVYEFMPNGNLDEWLHHKPMDKSKTLRLRQRLNNAINIASALEYLHFGTDSAIVHGDLKPSNVLIDEEMIARVGDFGLAKLVSHISSANDSSSVGIRGTIGYIAPEYGISGMVSIQGDVYSYGVLLLEMFTGRRPTDDNFKDSWSLHDFVKNAFPKQVMKILDPIITQEYNHGMNIMSMDCVALIFEIGLACSMELPVDRMKMTDVVNQLKKASQLAES